MLTVTARNDFPRILLKVSNRLMAQVSFSKKSDINPSKRTTGQLTYLTDDFLFLTTLGAENIIIGDEVV